jgi:3-oxoadipate enol-lactonase
MPTTTINGHLLHYEVHGEGPPLLFIHGGFGGINTVVTPREHEWAAGLTAAYRFIEYDRRSVGRSEFPEHEYDLAMLVADARDLLRHLRLDSAFVMGDSAGGPIALAFTLAHPELVRGLVLAETGARLISGGFGERIRARIEIFRRGGSEAAYAARREGGGVGLGERAQWFTLPAEYAERLVEGQRAALARLATTTRAERVRWYAGELRNYAAYLDVDLHPRLGEIACPTLVIHGDRDGLVPHALGERLAAGIPGAEFVTIPEADHGVMYFPGAVEAVRGWLDRMSRARAAV